MLVSFIRSVRGQRPTFIEVNILAGESWRQMLRSIGFRLRTGGRRVLVYWMDEEADSISQSADWFLTQADRDV